MKHLRLQVQDDLHRLLKIRAMDEAKNIPEVVIDALEAYLREDQQQSQSEK
jgi:hypothetical protein